MLDLPQLWPHQEKALWEIIGHLRNGTRRILFTSPTGGGKTRVFQEVLAWALEQNWKFAAYTNRNLLREQLSRVMEGWGFDHGVRAANTPSNLEHAVQICSVQTEANRVLGTKNKNQAWSHHPAQIVVTDEVHLNQGNRLSKLKELHDADGAAFLDITATPLDLVEKHDVIVQGGTASELRACNALLWAQHYAINEPDTKKVRANKVGELEIEPGQYRSIWMKSIVGSVLGNYRTLNPDRRPTILFAPGVEESIWFAEQFTNAGHRWAHIDGSSVWLDGELHQGNGLRDEVIRELRHGKILGVSNRFVLREGIDIPELYLGILATVFGSLQSYLQSVGRILRFNPELPGHVRLQDHGGNWWRHGSANADRIWKLGESARIVAGTREANIREGKEKLPITCPKCGMIRMAGPKCLGCGSEVQGTRSREVIQHDGSLTERSGSPIPPRHERRMPDTEDLWRQIYYRAKKSRNKMTFRQSEALFVHENGYWPPRDLPLMPRESKDWFMKVRDVPVEKLR
jgi:DNA repair protein RadD